MFSISVPSFFLWGPEKKQVCLNIPVVNSISKCFSIEVPCLSLHNIKINDPICIKYNNNNDTQFRFVTTVWNSEWGVIKSPSHGRPQLSFRRGRQHVCWQKRCWLVNGDWNVRPEKFYTPSRQEGYRQDRRALLLLPIFCILFCLKLAQPVSFTWLVEDVKSCPFLDGG